MPLVKVLRRMELTRRLTGFSQLPGSVHPSRGNGSGPSSRETWMNDPIPTFDYFVVRLDRTDPNPNRITGLVERLGSWEKQPFDSAEHLARLISTWTAFGLADGAGQLRQAQRGNGRCVP
jgi:hypothetical protein